MLDAKQPPATSALLDREARPVGLPLQLKVGADDVAQDVFWIKADGTGSLVEVLTALARPTGSM